jgi:Family of unknown function (DUF6194)
VAAQPAAASGADEVVGDLLGLDPGLRPEPFAGETAIFYNPGRSAPLGIIFALVGHDGYSAGPTGVEVSRLAFGLTPPTFARCFGPIPPRDEVIAPPRSDGRSRHGLMPHPRYGWLCWVQILGPTAGMCRSLAPWLDDSLALAHTRWRRRAAHDLYGMAAAARRPRDAR